MPVKFEDVPVGTILRCLDKRWAGKTVEVKGHITSKALNPVLNYRNSAVLYHTGKRIQKIQLQDIWVKGAAPKRRGYEVQSTPAKVLHAAPDLGKSTVSNLVEARVAENTEVSRFGTIPKKW